MGLSYFKIKTYPSLEAPPNPEGDSKYLDTIGYGTKINEKIEKEDAKKKSPEELHTLKSVDIVDLNVVNPAFKTIILKTGVKIYDG